jgi:hypothetical protein
MTKRSPRKKQKSKGLGNLNARAQGKSKETAKHADRKRCRMRLRWDAMRAKSKKPCFNREYWRANARLFFNRDSRISLFNGSDLCFQAQIGWQNEDMSHIYIYVCKYICTRNRSELFIVCCKNGNTSKLILKRWAMAGPDFDTGAEFYAFRWVKHNFRWP